MPNCEHEMVGQGRSSPFIQWAMTYFFMAVNKGLEIPQISWNQDDDDQRFGLIAETTGDWEAEGRFAQTRGNTRLGIWILFKLFKSFLFYILRFPTCKSSI